MQIKKTLMKEFVCTYEIILLDFNNKVDDGKVYLVRMKFEFVKQKIIYCALKADK